MADIENEELAERFLNADAAALQLFRDAVDAWHALGVTEIPWQPMVETAPRTFTMGWPIYPGEVWTIYSALLTFLPGYAANDLGDKQEPVNAPLGYLIRGLLVTFRSERFSDGAVAAIIKDGTFDMILDRMLSAWNQRHVTN